MTAGDNSEPDVPDAVVCLVTAPRPDAQSIALAVLDKQLVACVNIVPLVQSLYWVEGKVEHDDEALLLLKTTRSTIALIDELLHTVHPYDNFELVVLDVVGGSHRYLEWIGDTVGRGRT